MTVSETEVQLGAQLRVRARAYTKSGDLANELDARVQSRNASILWLDHDDVTAEGVAVRAVGGGTTTLTVAAGEASDAVAIQVNCPDAGGGPLEHEGTISTSERWTAADGPHRIVGDLRIAGSSACESGDPGCSCDEQQENCKKPVELEIESCASVQVAAGVVVVVGGGAPGSLRVLGSTPDSGIFDADHPGIVRFEPDPSGGAGGWAGLVLHNQTSGQDTTLLRGVHIVGAGRGSSAERGAIVTRGSQGSDVAPTLQGVGISDSDGYGVVLGKYAGLTRASSGLVIAETKFAPWLVHPNQAGTVPHEVEYQQDGGAVEVSGGTVTHSATWATTTIPYLIKGSVDLSGDVDFPPLLHIDSGVTLRFTEGSSLGVGLHDNETGALQLGPTANAPTAELVTLTSAADAPTPGDWVGVILGPHTNPLSSVRRVLIEYAGDTSGLVGLDKDYANADDGALVLVSEAVLPFVQHNVVRESAGYAIVHAYTENLPPRSLLTSNPDIRLYTGTFTLGVESMPNPLVVRANGYADGKLITDSSVLCDPGTRSPPIEWNYESEPVGRSQVKSYVIVLRRFTADVDGGPTDPLWLVHGIPDATAGLPEDAKPGDIPATTPIAFALPACDAVPVECAGLYAQCKAGYGTERRRICLDYQTSCVTRFVLTLYALNRSTIELGGDYVDVEEKLMPHTAGVAKTEWLIEGGAPQ